MIIIIRDFNSPNNDIGEIVLYLSKDISNNKYISVDIMNLHEMGQAWMYVKYPLKMNLYDVFLSILNKLSMIIYTENNREIPEYKDIVRLDESNENSEPSEHWGFIQPFTRESIDLLEEYDCNVEEDISKHYIIMAEILENENGEFIYDKPIRSNSYKG